MSLSGSKSKTKASETFKKQENQTTSGVQTSSQSLNPWSLEQYNTGRTGILGTLDNYNQNSPYKAYSGPLTAGLTDPERQARALISAKQGQSGLLGQASGMISGAANAGPNLAEAAKVDGLKGYSATTAGSAQIGAMDQIGNRLGEIGKYQNPELSRVVDTTLASYDEDAARQRARMQAQGAAAGKFGGSRFGVEQGVFGADVARNRAGLEAGLRSSAYDRATGLLGSDVGTVNQGRMAQAGMDQQANMFNAGAANDASRFGADVNNQGILANAGYQQQANLTNAQAREQALGRQMQGAGLLANVQGQQFGQDMQVADQLRQMGMDERQIADLQILREMAQYDRQAADQLQRVQMQLQAQFGLLGAAPMLTDSRQTTDGTMSGTQSGSGSSTSKTSGMEFGINVADIGKMMAGMPA